MLNLGDTHSQGFARHEVAYGLLGSHHHIVKLLYLVVGKRKAGQGNEHVPRPALEPWVPRQHIVLTIPMNKELVCAVDQRVIKVVTWRAHVLLILGQVCQRVCVYLVESCREHHALPLVDSEHEVARHIQILVARVAALLLLGILQPPVPVGLVHKLVFLVQLHEQLGVPLVHTRLYAIAHLLEITARAVVLVGVFPYTAEGEKGLQPHCRGTM